MQNFPENSTRKAQRSAPRESVSEVLGSEAFSHCGCAQSMAKPINGISTQVQTFDLFDEVKKPHRKISPKDESASKTDDDSDEFNSIFKQAMESMVLEQLPTHESTTLNTTSDTVSRNCGPTANGKNGSSGQFFQYDLKALK